MTALHVEAIIIAKKHEGLARFLKRGGNVRLFSWASHTVSLFLRVISST